MIRLIVLLFLMVISLLDASNLSKEKISLGIFAYRPIPIMQQNYDPIIKYLNENLSSHYIDVKYLSMDELKYELLENRLDIFFTTPSQYIRLRHEKALASTFATLIRKGTSNLTTLGGVIVTKASREDIKTLKDVIDKKIATPGRKFFGGYAIQVYEFYKEDIDIASNATLIETMTHDNALNSLLDNKSDLAFIRTGLIEQFIKEGKIEGHELKVINAQDMKNFPYLVSTQLYPEWPLVALPHVGDDLLRELSALIFALTPDSEALKKVNIAGFVPAKSYLSSERVFKALRLPPFNSVDNFNMNDIMQKYKYELSIGSLFFISIFFFFIYRQYMSNKHNKKLEKLAKKIQASHDMLSKLTQNMPGAAVQFQLFPDGHATFPYASEGIKDIYGVSPEDVLDDVQPVFNNVHPDDLSMLKSSIKDSAQNMTHWHMEYRVNLAHKGLCWVEGIANPEKLEDGSILWHGYIHDITDAKNQFELYSQQVKENKVLTETTKDGLWIVDEDGKLLDVNDAYCQMSGYSKEELLSMHISDIEVVESLEETKARIEKIMENGSDTFDSIHRNKNEELFYVNVTSTFIDLNGVKLFTSIRDITESKEHEKEIKQLAYFDKLTKLPNRTLLSDRIKHAIKHSNRYNHNLAICMVDLDGFKDVNDSFGHDAGDSILIEAAKRMEKEVRGNDTVSRLGGDEFILLLTDVLSSEACNAILERVLNSLSKSYIYQGKEIDSVSASIGVTVYPADNAHADTLLRHADIAMYKSKNSGKNKFTFFDAKI